LFAASTKADDEDTLSINDLTDTILDLKVGDRDADQLREDAELLEGVYGDLPLQDYLSGKICPVFFGSAVNNFGVREMLDTFITIAPTPLPRETSVRQVNPGEDKFSGFIFKIHANLDPKHRDRIAFMRFVVVGSKEINITIMFV
jgi:peptide chain release factor 3